MEVCRICLSKQISKDISELQNKKSNDSYSDIMLFCLGIQVTEDSKVSTKLCLKCYKKILAYHTFKTQALQHDAYLRSFESDGDNKHETFVTDFLKPDKLNNIDLVVPSNIKEEHDYIEEDIQGYESNGELLSVVELIKYEFVPEENNKLAEKNNCIAEENKDIGEQNNSIAEENNDIAEENNDIAEETKVITVEIEDLNGKENAPIKKRTDQKRVKIDMKCEKKEREFCDECSKTVWNLKEHSAMHLPIGQRKRIKCEACDKTFLTNNARKKHFRIKHLGIMEHCDICNKDVAYLKMHHALMHNTASLPFECSPCGRRFMSRSKLAEHITIHTKERSFECEVCEKRFSTKLHMVRHKKRVHDKEKSHLCQFCSKSFFLKYHLQRHLRSHTKEKPYECAECGKSFTYRSDLISHQLIHSKVKMFECTHCDKTFCKRKYLNIHMISHTKEKKHPCRYCGVKFGRSDHRKRHEFTAHEKLLASAH